MRLVVTRSAGDAERQAARLRALGHEPLIHTLLDVVYPQLPSIALNGLQALIVTSRNALRGISRNGAFEAAKHLPAFCVGEGTAEFARDVGFSRVVAGEGTAKDLLPLIARTANRDAGNLLYLTGDHLAFDLEPSLKQLEFGVRRVIVYEAREVDESAVARLADELRVGVDGVILMSARTSSIFTGIIQRFKLDRHLVGLSCYCHSDAVALPLKDIYGLTMRISSHPTEADLMELIGPAPPQKVALADLKEALGKG